MISWAMATGFQGKTEDGCLIGPFDPILYSPGISTAFMDLHDAEEAHTSIDEQVRQVALLAVGSVWGTITSATRMPRRQEKLACPTTQLRPFQGAQASESQRTGPYRCELRT
jgi:hypothetical protein